MKKTVILLTLALVAALALAACGSNSADSGSDLNGAASDSATAETPGASAAPDDAMNQPATPPEGETEVDPGMAVDPAPDAETEIAPDTELAAFVDELYAAHPVELMMMTTTAVNLTDADWAKFNAGLDETMAAKVDAAVLSESMTGSQAYSLVLARVKDAADAQAVADAMLENIDMAKWVCVMADKARAVTFGDKVLFVMANSELADVDALVNAAKPLTEGGSFDYDMSKSANE